MNIITIRQLDKKNKQRVINEGLEDEIIVSGDYFIAMENLPKTDPLYNVYESMRLWLRENKMPKYVNTIDEDILFLTKELKKTHGKKCKDIKDYIAETDLYSEIMEEYKAKEKLALESVELDDYTIFEADAIIMSKITNSDFTPKMYAELILSKVNGNEETPGLEVSYNRQLLKMGTFRTYINSLLRSKEEDKIVIAKTAITNIKKIEASIIVKSNVDDMLGILGIE